MRLRYFLPVVPVLFFLLSGCRKPTSANWDVDVAIPLVNSHLSIKNFIGDSIFKADNTGLLNFRVTREITSIQVDSVLSLPDTSIAKTFTLPLIFATKIAPGQQLPFFPPTDLEFDISNGVALKKVEMRSGSLIINFSNMVSQPLKMLYIIPSAVKDGNYLTISEVIPPGVNSLSKSYDLAGYLFDMTGPSGNVFNTIVQVYTVTVNPGADTVVLQPGINTIADLNVTYSKLVPQYVEGYFGQQTIQVPLDTARLDLINNFQASNFMLSDASLSFRILNGFGAEFSGSLSNIKSINSAANNVVNLSTSQLSSININRATKAGTTVFPSVKTASLNAGNSTIVPFLSNLPDKLSYQGSIHVNPLGNSYSFNDFAFYGQGMRVQADINIPMRFNANDFRLKSKAAVELANVEQLDNIRSGNFVINATNGYPFKAQMQAYMLDENDQVIDSLFLPGKNIIESGHMDNQNIVVSPYFSKVLIPIDEMKVVHMRRTKSIQILTRLVMPPNPPDIKIYEHYQIDVNIVAEITYNVERK